MCFEGGMAINKETQAASGRWKRQGTLPQGRPKACSPAHTSFSDPCLPSRMTRWNCCKPLSLWYLLHQQ